MRVACITMVRDEDLFLRIWFRHYSREFGAEHCYVIDHNSGPSEALDEVRRAGGQVLRIPFDTPPQGPGAATAAPKNFDAFRFKFINKLKNALFQFYGVVLFNDVDEILVPDPARSASLAEYLRSRRAAYRTAGVAAGFCLEMFHDYPKETAYDLDRGLFEQRRHFCYSLHYSKPAILLGPYRIEGHSAQVPFLIDPDLYLLHLKRIDLGELRSRLKPRQEMFETGAVGKTWSKGPDDAEEMIDVYRTRRRSDESGAHTALLRAFFKERDDGLFEVHSLHPDGNRYLARSAVPEARILKFQARRFTLDPAFATLPV